MIGHCPNEKAGGVCLIFPRNVNAYVHIPGILPVSGKDANVEVRVPGKTGFVSYGIE